MTRYNAIGVVYHDVRGQWIVEQYSVPGPQYGRIALYDNKDRAERSAVNAWNDQSTIGIYFEQSNHFPIKFDANLDLLNEVLARDGETFDGEWLAVRKKGDKWNVYETLRDPMRGVRPGYNAIEGFDKKTEAKDQAKTLVVVEDRPGVIIHKADGDPQKVKIWGSRFWSKLGDRVRGNMKSSQARVFQDAQDQL